MATETTLRPGEIKDILLKEIEAADLHELDVEEVGSILEVDRDAAVERDTTELDNALGESADGFQPPITRPMAPGVQQQLSHEIGSALCG